MNIELTELQWTITDDFSGSNTFSRATDWVGLSSADIYVDDKLWGFYVAYWEPNIESSVRLMISSVDESMQSKLVTAFECKFGSTIPSPIEPDDCPWDGDIAGNEPIPVSDFVQYTRAEEAMTVAKHIIKQDPTILKPLGLKTVIVDDETVKCDEYGYRKIERISEI